MGKIDHKPRPVSVGTFRTTSRMRYLVNRALDNNRVSYGEMSQEFEDKFADIHNCKFAILSNSGTSSLQVALQTIKEVERYDNYPQVIVPATTFVATANVVRHNNMVPVFVDVDPHTYNMDMNLVRKAITKDTKVIIPVHLFGQSADMTSLSYAIEDRPDIKILEDSCESMFVSHKHKMVGSMGDIGCFSTYVAHLIVTGVGGISTTNNPKYAAKMRSLVNHGLELKYLNVDNNFRPKPMPGRRFMFDSVGHSYRITELEAALGVAQLGNYEEMLAIRRRNANHLNAGLRIINKFYGDPVQTPVVAPGNSHSYMMYPLVLRKKPDGTIVDKTSLVQWLNEHQIETRDMLPLINQPIYSWLNASDYPVSDWLVKSGLYVGCHQNLESDDIQYVVQTIEKYFDQNGC